MYEIKDINLKGEGLKKIAWVEKRMSVLKAIEEEFKQTKPFRSKRIAMSIHLEAKTAHLALVLQAAGAEVWVTGCNTLSTKDDVAAALASKGVNVFAIHDANVSTYIKHLRNVLKCEPHLFIDDGGDLMDQLIYKVPGYKVNIIGGCEETTTGVHRLKSLESSNSLPFPMINVNDAKCKHYYDNVYGTGQSTWTAIMKATNSLIAGKTVVVAGYGYCGRGIAKRAAGMGANVIVTEIDPVKAIEATMDGFRVMPMNLAALFGDIFVTATGCIDVITAKHFRRMKDNAILANAGHFNAEINLQDLLRLSKNYLPKVCNDIDSYIINNGRTINVLAEGKLVNLATSVGDGHPAEIMDMSFSVQALSLKYLVDNGRFLTNHLYDVPKEIDDHVSKAKLKTLGIQIDKLSDHQQKYLGL